MINHQAMTIRDYLEDRHFSHCRRRRAGYTKSPDESQAVFHNLLRNQNSTSSVVATSGLTVADYRATAIDSRRLNTILSSAEAKQSDSGSDHLSEGSCKMGNVNKQCNVGDESPQVLTNGKSIGSATPSERAMYNEMKNSLPQSGKAKEEQVNLIDRSIQKAARKYDLAPKLIKAIIRAESNFQVDARSTAGAEGLMQLMPGTAKELGVKDSFDIDQNIDGGSRYLRQMLDRYSGNLRMALSAYNAGPGNVDKFGGRVPFAETRQYVDRVLRFSRLIA